MMAFDGHFTYISVGECIHSVYVKSLRRNKTPRASTELFYYVS